ncbi:MAG: methyl-accepting chemotaxis protein [Leptonema sp. (in: bacteria)]
MIPKIKTVFNKYWNLFVSLPISLSKKLLILIAFLESGAIVTTGIFILVFSFFIFNQNTNKRAYEIGRALENFAVESLVKNDLSRFQKILEKLSEDKSIRYIILQDKYGQALSHTNIHYTGLKFNDKNSIRVFYTTKDFYQNYYDSRGILYTREFAIPLNTPFGKIGYLRIGMNYDLLVFKPLINTSFIILIMVIAFSILGVFIAIPATKILLIPVVSVKEATFLVAQGDLTTSVNILSKDEIGNMANSFNEMIKSQKDMVSLITKIAEEITLSASDLASSTQEVTASSTQISNTVQEVSKDTVKGSEYTKQVINKLHSFVKLLENAKEQAEKSFIIAQETNEISNKGREIINMMNETSQKIYQGSQQTLEVINKLSELSKKIETITSAINGITGQITLLALNASIEAARAGEYGRGFAVVADEISKLADQSSKQAKEVNQIVNQIISFTKQSVETTKIQFELVTEGIKTNKVINEFFEKITFSANNIADESKAIKEIAVKEVMESNEVVNSIQELNQIMQKTATNSVEVNQATKETLNSIEEITRQSLKLNNLAMELKKMVSKFKIS